jgi:hypothetical protein
MTSAGRIEHLNEAHLFSLLVYVLILDDSISPKAWGAKITLPDATANQAIPPTKTCGIEQRKRRHLEFLSQVEIRKRRDAVTPANFAPLPSKQHIE